MEPVAITSKVLTYKILNRLTDAVWIDWAYEMLLAGFETTNLLILAGMGQQREYFEMRTLTDKVFADLKLDYSDTDKVIEDYAIYLSKLTINGEMKPFKVLRELKDIYIEMDYYEPLQQFYFLYFAKEDLLQDEVQWYINGVDRSNIDQTIIDYFKEWTRA